MQRLVVWTSLRLKIHESSNTISERSRSPLKPRGQLRFRFVGCESERTGMFPAPDRKEVAYKIATLMSDKAWRVGVARPGDGHVPC